METGIWYMGYLGGGVLGQGRIPQLTREPVAGPRCCQTCFQEQKRVCRKGQPASFA